MTGPFTFDPFNPLGLFAPVQQPDASTPTNVDAHRLPFPQFNAFRPFVIKELRRRKNTYPTLPSTPFVRMTSTCTDATAKYKFFSLGLHGYNGDATTNIFDLTYSDNQHDAVGTAIDDSNKHRRVIFSNELTPDLHMSGSQNALDEQKLSIPKASRPMPGITSVSVKRHGLGQPMVVSVQWSCYNRGQLEFLRNHFLIPGNYVILEFGQNFTNKPVTKTIDFKNENIFDELLSILGVTERTGLSSQYGRAKIINDYNLPNDGNYDLIVGQVGNFEITYEPETNIYKCMTSIVSQGENIWGIKIEQTFTELDKLSVGATTTIKDYFDNKLYDTFIQNSLTDLTKYGKQIMYEPGANFASSPLAKDPTVAAAAEAAHISTNPEDYAFLTWDFVFNDLLSSMFSVIKNDSIRKQLTEFMQFGKVGIDDFVGYHRDLLSAEPETLLLINVNRDVYVKNYFGTDLVRRDTIINEALGQYIGGGRFGNTHTTDGQYGAKINEGVWINSAAIRECFSTATDIRQAITSLLSAMNRAVGNYWQLQLFNDEDAATYKIIDYKFGNQSRHHPFYKFNVGGAGECLSVGFDSAFPPELISQMMLVAKFQAATQKEKDELLGKYPLLGSTSKHLFVLNWSTLKDELQDRITALHSSSHVPSSLDGVVVGNNSTTSVALSPHGSANQSSRSGRTAGEQVGVANARARQSADATRPIDIFTGKPTLPYPLFRLPVDGGVVTSGYGLRDISIPGKAPHTPKLHKGADIKVDRAPVYATNAGTVYRLHGNGVIADHTDYGGVIYIRHTDGWESVYGHLSSINVRIHDHINVGDLLGISGGGANDPHHGSSTGRHLHYELRNPNGVSYPGVLYSLNRIADTSNAPLTFRTDLLALSAQQPNFSKDDNANIARPDQPNTLDKTEAELKLIAIDRRRDEVSAKFGNAVWTLTAPNRGGMINTITLDGYNDTSHPNSFVAPYSTATSTTVELLGIAGISISDGFFVDKIPFTFEKHGVFQVTEINDEITTTGWRTKVQGYFKMLWYDANGQPEVLT